MVSAITQLLQKMDNPGGITMWMPHAEVINHSISETIYDLKWGWCLTSSSNMEQVSGTDCKLQLPV